MRILRIYSVGCVCDDLCRSREGDAEGASREILKELAAEWEERDGEMVEAEFRQ